MSDITATYDNPTKVIVVSIPSTEGRHPLTFEVDLAESSQLRDALFGAQVNFLNAQVDASATIDEPEIEDSVYVEFKDEYGDICELYDMTVITIGRDYYEMEWPSRAGHADHAIRIDKKDIIKMEVENV